MYFLFSILYSVHNFTAYRFNSTANSLNLPHILFPYSSYHSSSLSIFNDFCKETSTEERLVTSSIDCSAHPTLCSMLKLKPGKVGISFPPHDAIRTSKMEVTLDNLRDLAADVIANGVRKLNNEEDVAKEAKKRSLFALVARANAGDLEIKLPVLEDLAKRLIGFNVCFALITNMTLYEKYSHYPLSMFVYITPNLEFTSFRGDFELMNLGIFVKSHEKITWGSPIPIPNDRSIVYLGNVRTLEKEIKNKFKEYEAQYTMIYSDKNENKKLFNTLCEEGECMSIVDFKSFKAIKNVKVDTSAEDIIQMLNNFDEKWKNITLLERSKTFIGISFSLYSHIYYVCAIIFLMVLSAIILYFVDVNREIEDPRIQNKKKNN